ncbi:MAG: hypothetical protein IIB19_06320 [Chloroflexi bacterium]|nr:hypothetical protein [Chloroflexota bacterium]
MATVEEDTSERLRKLSGSARRLLDYVVVLEGSARYAVLRHTARLTEADMIEDLREVVEAGFLSAIPGHSNSYDFVDEDVRALVLADVGDARLPKLRARALSARRRVEGVTYGKRPNR